MLFEFLLNVLAGIIKVIFKITSILPEMPQAITDILTSVTAYAVSGAGFMMEILGTPLTLALFAVLIVVIPFYITWRMMLFIYKLIRG